MKKFVKEVPFENTYIRVYQIAKKGSHDADLAEYDNGIHRDATHDDDPDHAISRLKSRIVTGRELGEQMRKDKENRT